MKRDISLYWLCFVVFFGISAIVPLIPDRSGAGTHALIQDYYYAMNHHAISSFGAKCLLVHMAASTATALYGALIIGRRYYQIPETRAEAIFDLRSLVLLTAGLASVFGLIRFADASPILYFAVLFPWLGRLLHLLIIGGSTAHESG